MGNQAVTVCCAGKREKIESMGVEVVRKMKRAKVQTAEKIEEIKQKKVR